MQSTFVIKRGDTSPSLRYLLPSDLSLAGAQVRFLMRRIDSDTVLDTPADIESIFEPAIVAHLWAPGQTDKPGRYQAEFEVTYSDGAVETFPNRGFINVIIPEDVASSA